MKTNTDVAMLRELERTTNEYWDSLPDTVKEALKQVYDKYEESEEK